MRAIALVEPTTPTEWSELGPIVVGCFTGPELGRGDTLLRELLGTDVAALAASDRSFTGELGQLARLTVVRGGGLPVSILAIGLGSPGELTPDTLRDASMQAARSAGSGALVNTLALELDSTAAALRAVVEGAGLGDYRYRRFNSHAGDDRPDTEMITVLVEAGAAGAGPESAAADSAGTDQLVAEAQAAADAANWVRQLAETPSNLLGPAEFAAAIIARAAELAPDGLTASEWTVDDLRRNGFGALLAVGGASARLPRVVELRTVGRDGEAPIALAGKGITFDSGGINLKRDAAELAWMKSDMAAAAAVAAAVIAVASRGAGVPLHVILPIADNMPGGSALRPGDVLTHPGGRTTEVNDTDCEGRLVLADAIGWLAKTKPLAIIDVGTLTDSGGVGTAYWGAWGTDPALGRAVVQAGSDAGDPGWLLPLHPRYLAQLESTVADATNAPQECADSGQIAATYLRPFAGDVPWLHIDNGAGAYLEHDDGPWQKGATGTPVRALIEYLRTATAESLGADRV